MLIISLLSVSRPRIVRRDPEGGGGLPTYQRENIFMQNTPSNMLKTHRIQVCTKHVFPLNNLLVLLLHLLFLKK